MLDEKGEEKRGRGEKERKIRSPGRGPKSALAPPCHSCPSAPAGQKRGWAKGHLGISQQFSASFQPGPGHSAVPGSLSLGPWQEASHTSGPLQPLLSPTCPHNGTEETP